MICSVALALQMLRNLRLCCLKKLRKGRESGLQWAKMAMLWTLIAFASIWTLINRIKVTWHMSSIGTICSINCWANLYRWDGVDPSPYGWCKPALHGPTVLVRWWVGMLHTFDLVGGFMVFYLQPYDWNSLGWSPMTISRRFQLSTSDVFSLSLVCFVTSPNPPHLVILAAAMKKSGIGQEGHDPTRAAGTHGHLERF